MQKDYLKNERHSIARISNTIYFHVLELLECFIQTQSKGKETLHHNISEWSIL